MKLRDRIARIIVRKTNLNPEKNDRAVEKLQRYTRLGKIKPHKIKRGYKRLCYEVNGRVLEVCQKEGVKPRKIIYVAHGGAFIMGLINSYRNLYVAISKEIKDVAVAVIDYRIAPEHTYPAAHDDMRMGWEFLQHNLGYDASDIVLMGDSAGGNLVLSLLLKLRDEKKAMPAAAVVMSAWTDFLASGESYKSNYNRDIIFGRKKGMPDDEKLHKLLDSGVFSYAHKSDRTDPYLSPVFGEYHEMPPILMTAGSHEMPLDDTLSVSKKLKVSGSEVRVIIGEGMFHAYPLFFKISPTAKATFSEILSFIKQYTE